MGGFVEARGCSTNVMSLSTDSTGGSTFSTFFTRAAAIHDRVGACARACAFCRHVSRLSTPSCFVFCSLRFVPLAGFVVVGGALRFLLPTTMEIAPACGHGAVLSYTVRPPRCEAHSARPGLVELAVSQSRIVASHLPHSKHQAYSHGRFWGRDARRALWETLCAPPGLASSEAWHKAAAPTCRLCGLSLRPARGPRTSPTTLRASPAVARPRCALPTGQARRVLSPPRARAPPTPATSAGSPKMVRSSDLHPSNEGPSSKAFLEHCPRVVLAPWPAELPCSSAPFVSMGSMPGIVAAAACLRCQSVAAKRNKAEPDE